VAIDTELVGINQPAPVDLAQPAIIAVREGRDRGVAVNADSGHQRRLGLDDHDKAAGGCFGDDKSNRV
jgi:hypothetical protein